MSKNLISKYWEVVPIGEVRDLMPRLSDAPMEPFFRNVHLRIELLCDDVVARLAETSRMLGRQNALAAHNLRVATLGIRQMRSELAHLSEMTPFEFTQFRRSLGAASGLQSPGIRSIQFMAGLRLPRLLQLFEGSRYHESLKAYFERPSLWEVLVTALQKAGFPVATEEEQRAAVQAIYLSPIAQVDLKAVVEGFHLLDAEYRKLMADHMMLALREIGSKPGTGATATATVEDTTERYLIRGTAPLFPLLWQVAASLPEAPASREVQQ